MSKRLVHELVYDAPASEVAAMLADPAFRKAVCDHQGVVRSDVSVQTAGAGTEVVVERVHSADQVPSFARKIVGDEITIVQTETWTTPERADISMTIPGKPGEIDGRATLVESGGTTTETVELTIKVSIPLVGGKLEGLISDLLLAALKAENRVGREYLTT